MSHPNRDVECTVPVLPVRDLGASIAFYTDTLGFVLDWDGGAESMICSVSRDGCSLMIGQGVARSASPQWVWIGLQDATFFETWEAAGVRVSQAPQNWSWGCEMKFEDLGGNILWVGTRPRSDPPRVDGDGG